MELIVDANILISALIKDADTRKLLLNKEIILFAPAGIMSEVDRHKETILGRSKISEDKLNIFLSIIFSRIKLIPFEEFGHLIKKAGGLCPESPEDVEYIALALRLNLPIWSNDKLLKKQSEIKVYSTGDLINSFSL